MLPFLTFAYLLGNHLGSAPRTQAFSLGPYVGKDLTNLRPQDLLRFSKWCDETFQGNPSERGDFLNSKVIAWRTGRVRYAAYHGLIPMDSVMTDSKFVYAFDQESKLAGSMWLRTGQACEDVSVVDEPELGAVLGLRFNPGMNWSGSPDVKAIPAVRVAEIGYVDGHPAVLRVLFPDGSLDRPQAEVVTPLPVKQVLRSGTVPEELAVLAWLASPQWQAGANPTGQSVTRETASEDAKAFAALRSDPEIDREIDALASSPSPAVRQAAKSYKWWFDFASKKYR